MIPFDQIQSALARLRGILCAYFDRRAAARIERRTRAVRAQIAEAKAEYLAAPARKAPERLRRLCALRNRQIMLEIGCG